MREFQCGCGVVLQLPEGADPEYLERPCPSCGAAATARTEIAQTEAEENCEDT